MSGILRRSPSIGANALNDDQLTTDGHRDQQKTAGQNGVVSIYATQSATGLRLAIFGSGRNIATNLEPFISSTGPLLDGQHFLGAFPIFAGEVVALQVINTTAGAITLFYHIDIP